MQKGVTGKILFYTENVQIMFWLCSEIYICQAISHFAVLQRIWNVIFVINYLIYNVGKTIILNIQIVILTITVLLFLKYICTPTYICNVCKRRAWKCSGQKLDRILRKIVCSVTFKQRVCDWERTKKRLNNIAGEN